MQLKLSQHPREFPSQPSDTAEYLPGTASSPDLPPTSLNPLAASFNISSDSRSLRSGFLSKFFSSSRHRYMRRFFSRNLVRSETTPTSSIGNLGSIRPFVTPPSFSKLQIRGMKHHLMVGTWTPPGAIFTFEFDDETLSLNMIKRTEINQDEPISWMTFDVSYFVSHILILLVHMRRRFESNG